MTDPRSDRCRTATITPSGSTARLVTGPRSSATPTTCCAPAGKRARGRFRGRRTGLAGCFGLADRGHGSPPDLNPCNARIADRRRNADAGSFEQAAVAANSASLTRAAGRVSTGPRVRRRAPPPTGIPQSRRAVFAPETAAYGRASLRPPLPSRGAGASRGHFIVKEPRRTAGPESRRTHPPLRAKPRSARSPRAGHAPRQLQGTKCRVFPRTPGPSRLKLVNRPVGAAGFFQIQAAGREMIGMRRGGEQGRGDLILGDRGIALRRYDGMQVAGCLMTPKLAIDRNGQAVDRAPAALEGRSRGGRIAQLPQV